MKKNLCAKLVKPESAYEVYQSEDGQWTYFVLKKYQSPNREEKNVYARWYCKVISPANPTGEYRDTYVSNVKLHTRLVDNPLCSYVCCLLGDDTTIPLNKYRFAWLCVRHLMLVNYIRVAVPKAKLNTFKRIAAEHATQIICIDSQMEVEECLNDWNRRRIQE